MPWRQQLCISEKCEAFKRFSSVKKRMRLYTHKHANTVLWCKWSTHDPLRDPLKDQDLKNSCHFLLSLQPQATPLHRLTTNTTPWQTERQAHFLRSPDVKRATHTLNAIFRVKLTPLLDLLKKRNLTTL